MLCTLSGLEFSELFHCRCAAACDGWTELVVALINCIVGFLPQATAAWSVVFVNALRSPRSGFTLRGVLKHQFGFRRSCRGTGESSSCRVIDNYGFDIAFPGWPRWDGPWGCLW